MPPDITVYQADARDVLSRIDDDSIDSVVTDPPYALVSILKRFGKPGSAAPQEGADGRFRRASVGFMGQEWDTGETAHDPEFWQEVARVLKPGAHLLAFGGTRTYHRMACAIEDAGFEIRDMVAWLYGTGFPKSHDMPKAIEDMALAAWLEINPDQKLYFAAAEGMAGDDPDKLAAVVADFKERAGPFLDAIKWEGWGTALKPALEPIVMARLPIAESSIARNVVEHGTGAINIDACRIEGENRDAREAIGGGNRENKIFGAGEGLGTSKATGKTDLGRWPANVAHDNSDEVLQLFPERQAGRAPGSVKKRDSGSDRNGNQGAAFGAESRSAGSVMTTHGDAAGSAARFFFSAKADKLDRWGSKHPTVKRIDLIRWLIRMVTPPGGTVLDPFAGSGTAGVAALAEGMNAVLIERNADYAADIEARLAHYRGDGRHSLAVRARHKAEKPGSLL